VDYETNFCENETCTSGSTAYKGETSENGEKGEKGEDFQSENAQSDQMDSSL